jgi:hypothetical protein
MVNLQEVEMIWKIPANVLLLLIALGCPGKAQNVLQSGVVGSGGGISTANGKILYATLGQPAIGKAQKDKVASIGFWYMRKFPAAVAVDRFENQGGTSFDLSAGYPNPFSVSSQFQIQVPKSGRLVVSVFDLYGRLVRTLLDRDENAGVVTIFLSSAGLESGRYFIHALLGSEPRISSIVVIK